MILFSFLVTLLILVIFALVFSGAVLGTVTFTVFGDLFMFVIIVWMIAKLKVLKRKGV